MRREYIDYRENMNIDFRLAEIRNYPLVWQDSIRIFFVLRGSIIVGIENEEFRLREGSLEIVNENEPYYIKAPGDNLVLILDIRPDFFTSYSDLVDRIYYYTDTLENSRQGDSSYTRLRYYISILYYEFTSQGEGYEEKIEETLLRTMNHLLNNFHYLLYEEESLKEDQLELERFTRIISYLRTNYAQGVSLKEIAEREHLTPQYLSYKIKDTFGQSFNDFLNKIRVEESRKLLLDTDKSIWEIGQDIGFSHSRYYNKHFKRIHGISPRDYRAKYGKDQEEVQQAKAIKYLDLDQARDYIGPSLAGYPRYRMAGRIVKKQLDLGGPVLSSLSRPSLIEIEGLDHIFYDRELMTRLGQDLGLSQVLLRGEADPYQLELAREVLGQAGLELIRTSDLREGLIFPPRHQDNDGLEVLARLFEPERGSLVFKLRDTGSGQLFTGDRGLVSRNNIRKPIYHGLDLLAKMGQEVIYSDQDLLVARSKEGYDLLFYNRGEEASFSLNLEGLEASYGYRLYRLEEETAYRAYRFQGEGLAEDLVEDLRNYLGPRLELGLLERMKVQNLVYKMPRSACYLLRLNRV